MSPAKGMASELQDVHTSVINEVVGMMHSSNSENLNCEN